MVMISILLIVFLLTAGTDLYTYLRYVRRSSVRMGWKRTYIGQAVLLDIVLPAVVPFVAIYGGGGAFASRAMLWIMWLLILSLNVKVIFGVFAGLNELLNLFLKKKRHILDRTGVVLAGLLCVMMLYGVTAGVSQIRVENVTIETSRIPDAFDGYRIAFFSDLHIGNLPPSGRFIERIVEAVNATQPDLIVNGGDLVNMRSSEITPEIFDLLGSLKAPDGVVSVLGNHDLGIYIREGDGERSLIDLIDIQKKLGWELLQNRHIEIRRGADSLPVAGVDFPYNGRHNGIRTAPVRSELAEAMKDIDADRFSVLVSHSPSIWDSIPLVGDPDLTLSGHIHAMQVKFSLGKFRFSPAEWIYPQWSGLYVRDRRYLYINDGAGYVLYPMRIGAAPEVTVIELKKQRVR